MCKPHSPGFRPSDLYGPEKEEGDRVANFDQFRLVEAGLTSFMVCQQTHFEDSGRATIAQYILETWLSRQQDKKQ